MKRSEQLLLNMSPSLAEKLDILSEEIHCSKSDVLRKAIILFDLALAYKKKGNHLVVMDDQNNKVSEIVGL